MSRMKAATAQAQPDLPCCSVVRPKGFDMEFAASDHEYTFAILNSKWPYAESPLTVVIPMNEKTLTGADIKVEVTRLNNPRVEEYLIKSADARAVRYFSDLLEDAFRSALGGHRFEFVSIETSSLPKSYLVHLGRPQRDGRCLSTLLNEHSVNTLLQAFEVKSPKDLEGKGFDSVLKDPAEALSLFEMQALHPAYVPPVSSVLVHGLSTWITTGTVNEDWLRNVRGKMSEADRLKLDWKKKMRGEKTEEEQLKEQWQAKMRGEQARGAQAGAAAAAPVPKSPLAAVDMRTRTAFLRLFGSSNTASMDSLTFLLHNAGIEVEPYEPQVAPHRIRTLSAKDKPRRLLVWSEWDIAIMSEAEAREALLREKSKSSSKSGNKDKKDKDAKDKDKSKAKGTKKHSSKRVGQPTATGSKRSSDG